MSSLSANSNSNANAPLVLPASSSATKVNNGNNNNGNNDDGGSSSDSDESALIVWEDSTSNLTDLRHLLLPNNNNGNINSSNANSEGGNTTTNNNNRCELPIAMTQQIEQLSFDDDDSDEEEGEESDSNDNQDSGGGGRKGSSNINNGKLSSSSSTTTTNNNNGATRATMTPPPTSSHVNSSSSSSNNNGNSNDNHNDANKSKAAAPNNNHNHNHNHNHKLLNSGEIPATISKLKRRRTSRRGGSSSSSSSTKKQQQLQQQQGRGASALLLSTIQERHSPSSTATNNNNNDNSTSNDGGEAEGDNPSSSSSSSLLPSGKKEKKKQKVTSSTSSSSSCLLPYSQQQQSQRNDINVNSNHELISSHFNHTNNSSAAKNDNANATTNHNHHSSSPIGQRTLFTSASSTAAPTSASTNNSTRTTTTTARRTGLGLHRSHTHPPRNQGGGQRSRKIKLPPLGGGGSRNNNNTSHLEKENDGNQTSMMNGNDGTAGEVINGDGSNSNGGEEGKQQMSTSGNNGRDLFAEIELGLDRVCGMKKDHPPTAISGAITSAAAADDGVDDVVEAGANRSIVASSSATMGGNNVNVGVGMGASMDIDGIKEKIGSSTTTKSSLSTDTVPRIPPQPNAAVMGGMKVQSSCPSNTIEIVGSNGNEGINIGSSSANRQQAGAGFNGNTVGMLHRQQPQPPLKAKQAHSTNPNSTNVHSTKPIEKQEKKNSEDFEFDEEWDDADLAAIDLSVAMTSTQSNHNTNNNSQQRASLDVAKWPTTSSLSSLPTQQPPAMRHSAPFPTTAAIPPRPSSAAGAIQRPASAPMAVPSSSLERSASLPVPTTTMPSSSMSINVKQNTDEFDNDDDDWDLDAIDISVAATMTQSNTNIDPAGPTTSSAAATATAAISRGSSAVTVPSKITHSEFSDDDDDEFAEVDFSALDNTIVQHQQMIMTQQQHQPPPIDRPIFNRRNPLHRTTVMNDGQSLQPQQQQPLFLSFTRYVVRSVHEDLATFTRTVGVSLWKSSEKMDEHVKEVDRLKRLCDDKKQSSARTNIDGYMYLRGEFYHTMAQPGDILHLCSLTNAYVTDPSALPVILDSHPPHGSDMNDDLVLVIHPDELISPTLVSETVKCPRLAVLQSRLGSTGLSAKSAVIGTLRHDLFERCLRERDASAKSAAQFTRQILRNNAESLVGCGIVNQREAFTEVMKTRPQIQKFLQTYTSWNVASTKQTKMTNFISGGGNSGSCTPTALLKGVFGQGDTKLSIEGVYTTEERAHVPELGLKGNVDATVIARTKPSNGSGGMQDALMPVELKTGHSQNPAHNHLAQLSTYIMMLRARHGAAAPSATTGGIDSLENAEGMGTANHGMLLYLNHKNVVARNVEPSLGDVKTLIGQRNGVVCNSIRAARPRGVNLVYEGDEGIGNGNKSNSRLVVSEAPPCSLPSLQPSVSSCERCYKNRDCMMYAAVDANAKGPQSNPSNNHQRLLQHFTGHLTPLELDYFNKWDRLIDLERHASARDVISKSWLFESFDKEAKDGKCISSLVLDQSALSLAATESEDYHGEEDASIRFLRSNDSDCSTPLTNLSFDVGSWVIVSEDGTSFVPKRTQQNTIHNLQNGRGRTIRHYKMHILRGTVERIDDLSINVVIPRKEIGRLNRLVKSLSNGHQSNASFPAMEFRLDKDEYSGGMGILLQNLVNFFTLDIPSFSAESLGTQIKTKTLTANTEYSSRRRRLSSSIIQLTPSPRFRDISTLSLFNSDAFALDIPGCDLDSLKRDFQRLNSDQKGAVHKVIAAEDFVLIQGLPGTGKSATIAFLTRLLVSRGKRVLLTSYTHSAVDNLLCKLMESGVSQSSTSHGNASNPMLRIGRESACHLNVQGLLAQNIACEVEKRESRDPSSIEKPSVDYLHKAVSEAKVVGVSALTAPRSPLLAGQSFDFVIVDEAGQISQPAILGAMMAADKFVLVGDHLQLPPLVKSEVAEEAGYGISMLMHLAEGFPESVAKLTMQYRMNEEICHLSNIIAYKGLLKCGNDQIRHQKLELDLSKNLSTVDRPWIERALDPDQPVIFLDTDSNGWMETEGPINNFEASIVEKLVLSLSLCGVENSSIGIITPFRSQLRMLNEHLALKESKNNGLEICTIDRFQGRDKEAVIISLVKSNNEGKSGRLLQDFRRLNVAFSRAKKKMIIIGSYSTLRNGSDVMRPVLDFLQQRKWTYKLPSLS